MQRLRWGLIGCGDISRKRVAPALKELDNCELVAVSRARYELAEEFAREFGAEHWYANWRELLNNPNIEAVYIATPVNQHAEQTIAAAEAGKHVLCEKPMALSVTECERMIDACRVNNVKLGVAYYRHFYPVIARMKEIIAAGEIGVPVLAQINAFERFNPTSDNPRYWLVKKELSGGGPMMDFGCHRIEVLMNILGPIAKVHGFTARILFEREVEDTSTALFRFASGARGMLTVTHAANESQDTVDIFGSEGSLHVPSLNRGLLHIKSSSGEREETLPPHPNFHLPQIDEFTQAVLNNRESGVSGLIGREVALIEEAIYAGPEW